MLPMQIQSQDKSPRSPSFQSNCHRFSNKYDLEILLWPLLKGQTVHWWASLCLCGKEKIKQRRMETSLYRNPLIFRSCAMNFHIGLQKTDDSQLITSPSLILWLVSRTVYPPSWTLTFVYLIVLGWIPPRQTVQSPGVVSLFGKEAGWWS